MAYMQELEQELRSKLAGVAGEEDLIAYIKATVLKSFRNGVQIGRERGSEKRSVTSAPRKAYRR